jgi:hypothetical protein
VKIRYAGDQLEGDSGGVHIESANVKVNALLRFEWDIQIRRKKDEFLLMVSPRVR